MSDSLPSFAQPSTCRATPCMPICRGVGLLPPQGESHSIAAACPSIGQVPLFLASHVAQLPQGFTGLSKFCPISMVPCSVLDEPYKQKTTSTAAPDQKAVTQILQCLFRSQQPRLRTRQQRAAEHAVRSTLMRLGGRCLSSEMRTLYPYKEILTGIGGYAHRWIGCGLHTIQTQLISAVHRLC